jgi:hypothetical protein
MLRRLLGFTLTLAIVGSSLLPGLCRLTCALQDTPVQAAQGEHHSCHEPASAAGSKVLPVAHVCGHQNDNLVGLLALTQVLLPPAVVDSISDFNANAALLRRVFTPRVESSPPGTLALITPLRV